MTTQTMHGRSRGVAVWIFCVALIVLAMVVVGGATRLTGSGLSITQWRPVSGALPPMTAKAWQEDFDLYKATPQYRLVNRGMSLSEFKFIFWWEWAHRLLGRLVGAVFAIPLATFVILRRMPRRLIWRCVLLLALGGLQGAVGWWMVKSGLEARTSVAPERLAAHLSLALILLGALVWTGLEAWSGVVDSARTRRGGWRAVAVVLVGAVFLQCMLGALLAGNHGGLIDGDWPLMGGRVLPADYWRESLWAAWVHNPVATQFNHRLAGYAIIVLALGMAMTAMRSTAISGGLRGMVYLVVGLIAAQAALGVATLLNGVPLGLAIAHQMVAALLLAATVALAWSARRA